MSIFETLSQNFLIVNKTVLRKLGPDQTLVLSLLIDKWKYWNDKGELGEDGSFFKVGEEIQVELGLSERNVREAKKKLQEAGLITIVKKGLPSKHYFILNEEAICAILTQQDNWSQSETSTGHKMRPVDVTKCDATKIPSTKISKPTPQHCTSSCVGEEFKKSEPGEEVKKKKGSQKDTSDAWLDLIGWSQEDDFSYSGPTVDTVFSDWTETHIVGDRNEVIWSAMCYSWRAKCMEITNNDSRLVNNFLNIAEKQMLKQYQSQTEGVKRGGE